MYAAIEAGGTKWICAAGTAPDDVVAVERFETTSPAETIGHAIQFFQQFKGNLQAIGVGSFGPIDLHPASSTYGYITTTPKSGWQFTDVIGPLRREFNLPVGFDTDVNAAALGEYRWGAAQGLDTFVYITVGTGLGGGAMVNGKLLHGLLHPEMGHVLLPHNKTADSFAGACPFHGDCLEGMVSGPALEKRWQARGETLAADHVVWQMTAHSLALGLINIICILSPQRIILGGGVMHQPQLFPLVRREVQQLLNGYLQVPQITRHIDEYIVPPGLGDRAGMLGAIALAQQAARNA